MTLRQFFVHFPEIPARRVIHAFPEIPAGASSSVVMRILVTGASGFVGSLLVPRLLCSRTRRPRARARPRAGVRGAGDERSSASSIRAHGAAGQAASDGADLADLATEVEILRGDALSGEGLAAALAGVDVAYYLIHSMERPAGEAVPFDERDRIAARNFADAAARAGVARIVYLGGLLPREGAASHTSPVATRSSASCSPPSPTRSPCAPRS